MIQPLPIKNTFRKLLEYIHIPQELPCQDLLTPLARGHGIGEASRLRAS
jgi:hypothetical protein